MKYKIFFILVFLLVSCGGSSFTKRRYTKGMYVEKRGNVNGRKLAVKNVELELNQQKDNSKKAIVENSKDNFNPIDEEDDGIEIYDQSKIGFDESNHPIKEPVTSDLEVKEELLGDTEKDRNVNNMRRLGFGAFIAGIASPAFFPASLILGILIGMFAESYIPGVVIACMGILMGLIAVIFSLILFAQWKDLPMKPRKRAIVGLVLGIVGIGLGLLALWLSIFILPFW